jgi:ABC-2 type transport system ATP-binding protein
VLVSSHLLSEVSQSVDDIVVISHGELRASGSLQEVLARAEGGGTRVRAGETDALSRALEAAGIEFRPDSSGALVAGGAAPERVGQIANDAHIALSELTTVGRSLEDVFLELTGEAEDSGEDGAG